MAESDRSMAGKTCLVTGATAGIGEPPTWVGMFRIRMLLW